VNLNLGQFGEHDPGYRGAPVLMYKLRQLVVPTSVGMMASQD
jgi:hypothetical protein